jgi:hypothetical protein
MNLWLAGAAVLLAILGSFQLLSPYVLLFCVFLIGVGFAFHAPAWSAIIPDVVTDEELPSAATLGGLQLNVSITFEIEVDRMRGREFLRLMREVRLIDRRNGAFGWRLDEDLTRFNICRIEMMVASWTGYPHQRERLTKAEQETINKVWRLHVGEDVAQERYYLCVNRELDARGTTVTHPLSMPTIPLDLKCPRGTANVVIGVTRVSTRNGQ